MAGRGTDFVRPAWMNSRPDGGGSTGEGRLGYTPNSANSNSAFGRGGAPPRAGYDSGLYRGNAGMPESLKQAADGWTEAVADDGRVYYFNSRTGETTYNKPQSLMTDIELQLPTSSWREFVRDGRSYFYNSKTKQSVWEEPMEFTRYKERLRAMCSGDAPTKDVGSLALYRAARTALDECTVGSATEKEAPSMKRKTIQSVDCKNHKVIKNFSGEPSRVKDKTIPVEEAKNQFNELLAARKVPMNASWKTAIKYGIANDSRFWLLSDASDRELALTEYSSWRKKQLLEGLRKKLDELASSGTIHSSLKLSEAINALEQLNCLSEVEAIARKEVEDFVCAYLDELYDKEKAEEKTLIETFSSWFRKHLAESDQVVPSSFRSFWSKNPDNLNSLLKQPWFSELLKKSFFKYSEDTAREKVLESLKDTGDTVIDDLLDKAAICKKVFRAQIRKMGKYPCEEKSSNSSEEQHVMQEDILKEAAISSLEVLEKLIDSDCQAEVSEYPYSVKLYAFKRIVIDSIKRMEDFEDMLTDVMGKPHHVDISFEDAQAIIGKELEFEALKYPQLRAIVYDRYQKKLKKRIESRVKAGSSKKTSSTDASGLSLEAAQESRKRKPSVEGSGSTNPDGVESTKKAKT